MRIVYLSYSPVPSHMASSIQVMKMCNAFVANSHEVILFVPDRPERQHSNVNDVYNFYNVSNIFTITRIFFKKRIRLFPNKLFYSLLIIKNLKKLNPDLVYGRVVIGCALAAFLGYRVKIELHNKLPNILDKLFFRLMIKSKKVENFIFITHKLKNYYLTNYGINENKIIVAPDGADIPVYVEKSNFLVKHNNTLQMGYVGNLYKGKGIKIILEIAAKMPDIDFHIVGGTKKDILHWQTYIKSHNIHFHGFVDQSKVSTYINSFDICLLPNQKILTSFLSHKNNVDKISYGDVTSPLKMFQYMAHKKPIIASDLPVLREVLNEQNAFLVPPDDINAWINAIKLLKDNNDLRETIANNAYQDFINNYTWVKRAEKVLM